MRVGVYMDLTAMQFAAATAPGKPLRDLFAGNGGVVSFVRVMADTPSGVSRISPGVFGGLVTLCTLMGATCAPVFWPRKTWKPERWDAARLLALQATDESVLDIEHQAKTTKTLRALAQNSFDHFPYRSVITTHAGHPEADDPSWPNNPYEMQAYSTFDMYQAVGTKGFPGNWQRLQAARACNPTGLALAIYDQSKLGEPAELLGNALAAAKETGVERVCYWSLKHILRNKYAIPFLRDDAPRILGRCS